VDGLVVVREQLVARVLLALLLQSRRPGVRARVREVHRADHEPDREALGQLREEVGPAAAAEHALAGTAAERRAEPAAAAGLQQHDEDQHDGDEDVEDLDDLDEDVHGLQLWGRGVWAVARAIARKERGSSEAPPTRNPSTSPAATRSAALSGLTLP